MCYKMILHKLVGAPLRYMTQTLDLFCFGLGENITYTNLLGNKRDVAKYALHVQCPFSIKENNKYILPSNWEQYMSNKHQINTYYEYIHTVVENVLYSRVIKLIELRDNNNLKISFQNSILEIYPNGKEESWRLFEPGQNKSHLVASNEWIELQ